MGGDKGKLIVAADSRTSSRPGWRRFGGSGQSLGHVAFDAPEIDAERDVSAGVNRASQGDALGTHGQGAGEREVEAVDELQRDREHEHRVGTEPAAYTLTTLNDPGDAVVGEDVVDPFRRDAECKRGCRDVVGAH